MFFKKLYLQDLVECENQFFWCGKLVGVWSVFLHFTIGRFFVTVII
jgi:hypothetical protein